MGKNKAKMAISVAVAAKPEVEIWQWHKKSSFWPWFPIHSFRQFLAKTYRFATIQNVTDYRQTTDRWHSVPKAWPIVRSAKNDVTSWCKWSWSCAKSHINICKSKQNKSCRPVHK